MKILYKLSSRWSVGPLVLIALCCGNDVNAFTTSSTTTTTTLALSRGLEARCQPRKVMPAARPTSSVLYDKNPLSSLPEIDLSSLTSALSEFDLEQVFQNTKGDNEELGSRGEYYFAVQALLILFIVIGGLPFVGSTFQAM
jgi:hypothetical protein